MHCCVFFFSFLSNHFPSLHQRLRSEPNAKEPLRCDGAPPCLDGFLLKRQLRRSGCRVVQRICWVKCKCGGALCWPCTFAASFAHITSRMVGPGRHLSPRNSTTPTRHRPLQPAGLLSPGFGRFYSIWFILTMLMRFRKRVSITTPLIIL